MYPFYSPASVSGSIITYWHYCFFLERACKLGLPCSTKEFSSDFLSTASRGGALIQFSKHQALSKETHNTIQNSPISHHQQYSLEKTSRASDSPGCLHPSHLTESASSSTMSNDSEATPMRALQATNTSFGRKIRGLMSQNIFDLHIWKEHRVGIIHERGFGMRMDHGRKCNLGRAR